LTSPRAVESENLPSGERALELIAHRGASRERHENTLGAFSRAVEIGVGGIELDVHATGNGIVVVNHDPVPHGTPEDPALAGRAIAELTWKQLRTFSIAPNTGIPSLAQVLRTVPPEVRVYIEIKGRGIERQVVETISASRHPDRCAVHGFDHRMVRTALGLMPGLAGGILSSSYLIDTVSALRAAGARDYWIWRELADESLCREVHAAGGRVIVWTVDDPRHAAELGQMGVDGICTNDPELMRREGPPFAA
jgi:glycerophosphoryl diester phosphodiesterase